MSDGVKEGERAGELGSQREKPGERGKGRDLSEGVQRLTWTESGVLL